MNEYVLNKETRRIELNFRKEEYISLSDKDKKKLKSAFLFSGKNKAWVSRSTRNHFRSIEVAKELGFGGGSSQGTRLSYENELLVKQEKNDIKQSRFTRYSEKAESKASILQSEFNKYKNDISFLTQPIIRGHKGSEAFGKQRQRIVERYSRGIDEQRKSEYFSNKVKGMKEESKNEKFQDRFYLNNRIKQCEKSMKKYEDNIAWCKQNNNEETEYWIDKLDYISGKLSYLERCLNEIGGIKFNKDNLKVGYEIKIKERWETITKLNNKTVETQSVENNDGYKWKREYIKIEEMRIPKELNISEIVNPFIIGDIFVAYSIDKKRIIKAYRATKTTKRTVSILEIAIEDNKPINEIIIGNKEMRRQIKEGRINKELYVSDDNYRLYKLNVA